MKQDYLVFTRKWRPKTFDEIIGQEQVVVPLKRAIETGRIMHAYIFSGPRGIGKTTTARVFAKALNCEEGPTVNPCNKCNNCIEINEGTSLDVIEIDGASNRGIEEIRQLREHVVFGTAKGRYKIYIIDEVHMLTKEAFNALLKTLEEPPKHVIFIFATTDPQQIPLTILSRCQQFKFKRLAADQIFKNLKMITQNEKIDVEEKALYEIAKYSDGALRDAQRILDQAMTYTKGEKITDEIIRSLLGIVKSEILKDILKAIFEKNIKSIIISVEKIFEEGYDLKNFLRELVEQLKNILLIKIEENLSLKIINLEDFNFLKEISKKVNKKTLLYYIEKCIEIEQAISKSNMANITLEISLIDMLLKNDSNLENIEKEDKMIEEEKTENNENKEESAKFIVEDIEEDIEIKNLTKEIIVKRWQNVVDRAIALKEEDDFIHALEKCQIVSLEKEVLTIILDNSFLYKIIEKKVSVLEKIFNEEFKRNIKIKVIEKANYIKRIQTQKEILIEEIKNHPVVKKLEEIFGEFSEINIKKI